MKYLIFIFFSIITYGQNIVSGNVSSENGFIIQNVLVINIKTGSKTYTNNEGSFKIEASVNDELRFIKENYERGSKIVYKNDFLTPMSIQLIKVPIEIEEVNVAPKLTRDLRKDTENSSYSKKVVVLNNEIREYAKKPMTEVQPKNNIPSSFAPPDMYMGQLNLFGVLGLIVNPKKTLGIKNNKSFNFYETNEFYGKVKKTFYGKYFENYGMDEFGFESYVVYLDKKYKLTERYYNNFNEFEIGQILKNSIKEFIK